MPIAGQSPKEVVHTELHKFKHGALHSGSKHGPLVHNRKQAIAIALSEARRAKGRDMGGPVNQTLPFGMGAFGWPSYGMFNNQPQAGLGNAGSQPQSGTLGAIGQLSGQMSGAPSTPSPSQPPASAPQSQVVSSIPPVNPPIQSMNGQPAGSWTPPTFSAGNWSSAPGRDMGGLIPPYGPRSMMRSEARSMLHSGPINSIVPGRTDRHNVHVGSGAYVMPADAVSHLGQNNTKAGQAILSHMFGKQGPYGMGSNMPMRHGPGAPKPPRMQGIGAPHIPKFQSAGGGKSDHAGAPVPIVVAGGEFTIPPEIVQKIGGGDIKTGHKLLDKWVLSLRQKHIATLKGLPPPAKS